MGLYNALCFHALGIALCSTIGTIFNIKCSLNIQLARAAVPLNPYFWRLHTAIEIPFKNLGIPLQKILHMFLTQDITFLKNEQVIPLKSP